MGGCGTVSNDIKAKFQDVPLSSLTVASGPAVADIPPVCRRFWADLDDASTEAGGPDAPDDGPGAPAEDEAEARKLIMDCTMADIEHVVQNLLDRETSDARRNGKAKIVTLIPYMKASDTSGIGHARIRNRPPSGKARASDGKASNIKGNYEARFIHEPPAGKTLKAVGSSDSVMLVPRTKRPPARPPPRRLVAAASLAATGAATTACTAPLGHPKPATTPRPGRGMCRSLAVPSL